MSDTDQIKTYGPAAAMRRQQEQSAGLAAGTREFQIECELAELRAENERLKLQLKHETDTHKQVERDWQARAEKAEANNAALREGLDRINECACEFSLDPPLEHCHNAVEYVRGISVELLTAPDPGANVRACVEAARQYYAVPGHFHAQRLFEAVRALDEGSKAALGRNESEAEKVEGVQ